MTVTPINQAPTLNTHPQPRRDPENSGAANSHPHGHHRPGPGDAGQILTITATSSNPGLINAFTFNYTSPATTGTISYVPVNNAFGTAVITVTFTDNGGTPAQNPLNNNSISQTFTVTVTPVNHQPTLNQIGNPAAISENTTTPQTVFLSGISDGDNGTQVVTVTASSNNTALIPNAGCHLLQRQLDRLLDLHPGGE